MKIEKVGKMKKIFILAVLLYSNISLAYLLELPACQGNDYEWSNCHKSMNNGDWYSGGWKNGTPHGTGLYKWQDGSRYMGPFRDGKLHGHGSYRYPNGDSYTGFFENGRYHGKGILIESGKKALRGIWEHGEYIGVGEYIGGEYILVQDKEESTETIFSKETSIKQKTSSRKGGEDSPLLSGIAIAIFTFFVYLFVNGRPKKKKEDSEEENEIPEASTKEEAEQTEALTDKNKVDSKEVELQKLKDLYDKDLITKEVYESKQKDILKDE